MSDTLTKSTRREHTVHPNAIALFQEWYGIKHISGRLTQSLANIDNQVQNLSLLNHVNEGGLQYLIISLWQVPSFPETCLQKEADSTMKKLGKLKLVPKMLPPLTTSFLLRAPTPHVYPMVAVSPPPPPNPPPLPHPQSPSLWTWITPTQ